MRHVVLLERGIRPYRTEHSWLRGHYAERENEARIPLLALDKRSTLKIMHTAHGIRLCPPTTKLQRRASCDLGCPGCLASVFRNGVWQNNLKLSGHKGGQGCTELKHGLIGHEPLLGADVVVWLGLPQGPACRDRNGLLEVRESSQLQAIMQLQQDPLHEFRSFELLCWPLASVKFSVGDFASPCKGILTARLRGIQVPAIGSWDGIQLMEASSS